MGLLAVAVRETSISNYRGETNWDIWILPLFGDRKPFPFLQTQFNEGGAVFSPDGRWLAYESDESGKYEIYVAPFPGPGGKWQASTGGGRLPNWRRDGRGLYYVSPDNKMMAVDVAAKGPTIQAGVPRALFQVRLVSALYFARLYDVSPDGRRFLVLSLGESASPPLTLVVNWSADLNK